MYAMFVMVDAGGLMAIAQLAPIANDYKIAGVPVSILGLTLPALTFALTIDRVLNGICRPFFGWVSDHISRENTMFLAIFTEGVGIHALLHFANNPVLFVISWRSLPGARSTRSFQRPAPTSMVGSSQPRITACFIRYGEGDGVSAGPVSQRVDQFNRQLDAVFYVATILNIVAAVLALVVLRPMRLRAMKQGSSEDNENHP